MDTLCTSASGGHNDFADIAQLSAVHKSVIAGAEKVDGRVSQEEISQFGRAVGRCFSRFAYPDSVSEWLAPLADTIRSKARRLTSPEGRLLQKVLQFRVQSLNGWDQPPYDLRLVIVVKPTTLPIFADDVLPDFDENLQVWLYDSEGHVRRQAGDIAARIEAAEDAETRYWLWAALGDAWAKRCKFKKDASAEFRAEVAGITAEVVSADQFTLTMSLNSELMDLDDLSDSRTH